MTETTQIRTAGGGPSRGDAEAIATKERTRLNMILRRFFRHRLAVFSLAMLLLITAFAFLGPYFWPWDYRVHRAIPALAPPSWDHPFGTTRAGHDVMAQVMRGIQQTMKVGFFVAFMSISIGATWGAIAGFYRGLVDTIMMRIVDIIIIIPLLVLVLVLAGTTQGTSWIEVALIIGAFGWTTTSRVVRGLVLSLREQEFIEASRAMGASDSRIIFKHLLPNAFGVIIVDATLIIAGAILVEAALSFLGFGITIPDTSLGLQIQNAQQFVFTHPWVFYAPGVFIIAIVLFINFIGDGLRDALDPKQQMLRR
jgi:peptide/nickel transport system permease protein